MNYHRTPSLLDRKPFPTCSRKKDKSGVIFNATDLFQELTAVVLSNFGWFPYNPFGILYTVLLIFLK